MGRVCHLEVAYHTYWCMSYYVSVHNQFRDVLYDFCIKTTFGSSLPPVVCRRVQVLFMLLCVFTFLVPCCDVRYGFRIKTMFGSSLPQVVCRRVHVRFTLFVFVFVQWCPFLIVPSVFSYVYVILLKKITRYGVVLYVGHNSTTRTFHNSTF